MAASFQKALDYAYSFISNSAGQIFIVGGSSVYEQAVNHPECRGVFLTKVTGPMTDGDTFFPIDALESRFTHKCVSSIAFNLVKNCCNGLVLQGDNIMEKAYIYSVFYYHDK